MRECENLNKKKVNVKENKNRWSSDIKEIWNVTRRYGAYTSASWLWNWLIVNAEEQ